MKMPRKQFANRTVAGEANAQSALHEILVKVILGAVERCDDADAYAAKAAKAFAKGLAVFEAERAAAITEVPPSSP